MSERAKNNIGTAAAALIITIIIWGKWAPLCQGYRLERNEILKYRLKNPALTLLPRYGGGKKEDALPPPWSPPLTLYFVHTTTPHLSRLYSHHMLQPILYNFTPIACGLFDKEISFSWPSNLELVTYFFSKYIQKKRRRIINLWPSTHPKTP